MSGNEDVFQRDAAEDARAFELQRTFRALLACMARPGEVVCLEASEAAAHEAPETGLFPGTLMLADALLDAGTTFAVAADEGDRATDFIARRTHAVAAPAERAAYAIVPEAMRGDGAAQSISMLFPGTLEEPHRGATALVECSVLLGHAADGSRVGSAAHAHAKSRWELSGPGIEDVSRIVLDRADVMRARQGRSDEFPCGIDIVFVDGFGHMVAVPRSSACKEVESWDM